MAFIVYSVNRKYLVLLKTTFYSSFFLQTMSHLKGKHSIRIKENLHNVYHIILKKSATSNFSPFFCIFFGHVSGMVLDKNLI